MKKFIIFFVTAILFADFLPNKTYSCETIGIVIEKNGKKYAIEKTAKNEAKIKNMLKDLYAIKIQINKPTLTVINNDLKDTLVFANRYKNLDVYVTKDKSLAIFLDGKVNQIAVNVLASKSIIYYQCK